MTREELQALRTPLIALGVVAIVSLVLVLYSGGLVEASQQKLTLREAELRQARLRIQNAGEEKEMIARYLGPYQQLAQSGFVGEEQRINWLDGLRAANSQANIFGIEYDISAQRAYAHSAEFNPGQLNLQESVMRLRLRLLHEEDLPRFLQAFARQGGGYFTVEQCTLRRTKPAEAERTLNVQPNLAAECDLSWVTVRPKGAEKKG